MSSGNEVSMQGNDDKAIFAAVSSTHPWACDANRCSTSGRAAAAFFESNH